MALHDRMYLLNVLLDVYGEQKENIFVTRVQELDTNVNQFELLSGRLPENDQEAVTLGSSSFGVVYEEGEVVRLYLEEAGFGVVEVRDKR